MTRYIKNKMLLERLMAVIGLVLTVAGIGLGWKISRGRGEDFAYLYVLGRALAERKNPYDESVTRRLFAEQVGYIPENQSTTIFYPPSTGIVILPLTFFPYKIAQLIWFLLLVGVLPFGIWQLLKTAAPRSTIGIRMLVIGLIFCSSGVRWGFLLFQSAPLILGLFGLFFAYLHQRKIALASVVALIALCLKPTLWLPFLSLLLLHSLFVTTIGVCLVWLGLNVLAFLSVGGRPVFAAFRGSMALLEYTAGRINSSDPYLVQSLPRVDWPYLFNATHCGELTANMLGKVLTVFSVAWLLYEGWRARKVGKEMQTSIHFVLPASCLTLLAVYHHHYDSSILLVPLILFCCNLNRQTRLTNLWWAAVPAALYVCFYTQYQFQMAAEHVFGAGALPYLKLSGIISIIMAFIYSLVALNRYLNIRCAQFQT
jgi:hypothetical protein